MKLETFSALKSKWIAGAFVGVLLTAGATIGRAQSAQAAPAEPSVGAFATQEDRAFLGVEIEGEAEGGGVKLANIVDGSPAQKAGLQAGDVIVSLNDRTVGSEEELREAIVSGGVGQKVRIVFLRDGEKRRTSARLAAAPGSEQQVEEAEQVATAKEKADKEKAVKADKATAEKAAAEKAKATQSKQTPRTAVEINPPDSGSNSGSGYLGVMLEPMEGGGARVQSVNPDSPAEKAGLQAGDVIMSVEGSEVATVDSLVEMITSRKAGELVRLGIDRNGERSRIRATLGSRDGAMAGAGGAGRTGGPVATEPAPAKVTPPPSVTQRRAPAP